MKRLRILCMAIFLASTNIMLGVFLIMFGTSTVYILKPGLFDNRIFMVLTVLASVLILIFSFMAFWSTFKRSYTILETSQKRSMKA